MTMHLVKTPMPRAITCLLVLISLLAIGAKPNATGSAKAARAANKMERRAGQQPIKLPSAVLTEPTGPVMEVATIDRSRRPQVAEAAGSIDRLLEQHWQKQGVAGSTPLNDAQFVRRIYLELAGRIPTFDETVRFLDSKSATKRANLIDDLLESPDSVSHTYNFWADILRLAERPQKDVFFEPYLDWVKRSIAANRPYDQWVHEMLTADGKIWENPATGYQLRDKGMPLPYVDNTVRVFLGTQIGCAQCHDHPFDSWTQHQFYELAAFTSGTRMRLGGIVPRRRRRRATAIPGRDPRRYLRAGGDRQPVRLRVRPFGEHGGSRGAAPRGGQAGTPREHRGLGRLPAVPRHFLQRAAHGVRPVGAPGSADLRR
jgi:hypothetical protein